MLYLIEDHDIIKEPDFSRVKYEKVVLSDGHVIYNSIIHKNGKIGRVRCEVLVFNDKNELFCQSLDKPTDYDSYIIIPGGSTMPNKTGSEVVYEEALEEGKILIKNIRYTGIYYTNTKRQSIIEKLMNKKQHYDFYLTHIYVAEYDKPYTRNDIHKSDLEPDFSKNAKFQDYRPLKLRQEHYHAIIFYNEKIFETPELLNQYLNSKFEYGFYLNGENYINKDKDLMLYNTISPNLLQFTRCGMCWDYTDYEAYYFEKYFNYNIELGPLTKDNTYSLYYMQYSSSDGTNPSHTWLAFKRNNIIYSFESSWKSLSGVKEFKSEYEMIKYYLQQQERYYSSKYGKKYLQLSVIFKYPKSTYFGVSAEVYMKRIYDKGTSIKSDFRSYPLKYNINDHFYFYHLIPKSVDISGTGLISPQYMLDHNLLDLFDKSMDKYRDRIVNGWKIYPNRDPDSLSRNEIINAMDRFRGKDSLNRIYLFRYPPYIELGPNMNKVLYNKAIYRLDLNDPRVRRYIKSIDYGYYLSHTDNKKLDKSYYETISIESYFDDYNDDDLILFRTLSHISIVPLTGAIPYELLESVSVPTTIKDVSLLY